jgi:uncharacterized protein (DUF1800 family)
MTLFWHSHFGVSHARTNNTHLMCQHVQRLRQQALGSFDAMLEAVSNDPAVFLGLDAKANHRARPNEFFAQVFLEQFTLGSGHFSVDDVRETARAFTGWFVLRNELRYVDREHDTGVKRILGREGQFASRDVVRILLQHPATPQLLVRKLYRCLISETSPPPAPLISPLADQFAKNFNIGKLVETMLRSNLFFSPAAYRQKIKNPLEFALGIVKGLQGSAGTVQLGADLAALGQDLYQPPTVKGWAGGRYWINRFTLLGRAKLAEAFLAGSGPYGSKFDPLELARKHGQSTFEAATRFVLDLFLQGDLGEDTRQALVKATSESQLSARLRHFTGLVMSLPEFHLA